MIEPLIAAVIGSPIRQSLSPAIHGAAFHSTNRSGRYDAIECTEAELDSVIGMLRSVGAVGFSVTMPCKEAVARRCDVLDETARLLGAVNCVGFEDGRMIGHNTDGDGCCDALFEQASAVFTDATAVVLGAGGTARSVTLALLRRGARVAMVNRTAGRVEDFISRLAGDGRFDGRLRRGSADDLAAARILVNATSVGMGSGELPVEAGHLHDAMIVLDAVYHPLRTRLLEVADSVGARTVDGLWMLIHQARRQQEIWFGIKPDSAPMRAESERVLRERPTSL